MRNFSLIVLAALFACSGTGTQQTSTSSLSGVIASQSASLRVDVPSTSLSTNTDASGHFVLLGVPWGITRLHFSGAGVDATLEMEPMDDGEHRQISVTISGGNDAAEHDEEDDTKFKGAITAIAAPTITVAGHVITVTDATTGLSLSSLTVGENVEVEGTLAADGSVIAKSITSEEENEQEGDMEFQGVLTAISADGKTLTVAGTTVTVAATTNVEGTLAVGVSVKVEGAAQADGSVLATEIKVLDAAASSSVDVTGAIAALTGTTLTVGTSVLTVSANTQFKGQGQTHSLADFSVGDLVDVQASADLSATVVKRLSRVNH
jgi:hypothetical protein